MRFSLHDYIKMFLAKKPNSLNSRFSSSWCTKDAARDNTSKGVSILGKILIIEKPQIIKSKTQAGLIFFISLS